MRVVVIEAHKCLNVNIELVFCPRRRAFYMGGLVHGAQVVFIVY